MSKHNDQDMIVQVALLAQEMQSVKNTINLGISDIKKFTEKTISKETETAITVNDIKNTLDNVEATVNGFVKDLDSYNVEIKTLKTKVTVLYVWLAFLTFFVFTLLLFIASGASGARVAGEFTGGLINSVKP